MTFKVVVTHHQSLVIPLLTFKGKKVRITKGRPYASCFDEKALLLSHGNILAAILHQVVSNMKLNYYFLGCHMEFHTLNHQILA